MIITTLRTFLKPAVLFLLVGLFFYVEISLSQLYDIRIQRHDVTENQIPPITAKILGTSSPKSNPKYPERLRIPRINVDAMIEYTGTTPNGEIATPENTFDVGWYDLGAIPGDNGSAVIVGHLDNIHGEPGVFSKLNQLLPGDRIYVQDGEGTSIIFVVRELRIIDPGYAEEVFHRNDGRYLNLITCDGVWNKEEKSYSKRLVVFAELRESLF